jgi:hypothetical protein
MVRVVPLAIAFLALAVEHVLAAREMVSDERWFMLLVGAMAVAAVGSVIVAIRRRAPAAWIATGAFVLSIAAAVWAMATGGFGTAFEVAWSIAPIACAGGVAALVALRGGDWVPFAALAGLGQLIVLPPPAFAEIPFERIGELCNAHSGALGVAIQLVVGAAACAAAANRGVSEPQAG